MIKQTSSHSTSFKDRKKDRERLERIDKSDDDQPSKAEGITKIKEEGDPHIPYYIEHQLELNIQKYSDDVKEEMRYLLLDILKYPSTQDAYRHRCANRMGYHDLKHIKNKLRGESTYIHSTTYTDHCLDCGLLIQQKQIPTCSSIWQFPKVGLATFNLFKNMKLVMGFLFLLGAIFSIIELYINIVITRETLNMDGQNFPIFFSNAAQTLNSSSNSTLQFVLSISGFILIVVIMVWWITIFIVQCISQKYQRIVDETYLSAADFSIMLQNVPLHYSEQQLRDQFNRYFDSLVFNHNIKNTWGQVLKPFTLKKISRAIPFFLTESEVLDRQLQGLDDDIYKKKRLFADWVIEMIENSRFTYTKPERERQYFTFEKMLERRKSKVREIQMRAKQQYERAQEKINTTVIASFQFSQSADIIEHLNPQTLPAKIRYYISFCKSTQYFEIRDYMSNQELGIIASRAPEPEDIVWGNVEVPLCTIILRKLLTWSLMLLLSGALLGIVWGLSVAQVNGASIWASLVIALAVTLTNMLVKFTLRKISQYEKDFTETDRQRGILLKGLFVMAINWIIPIVVTNVVNQNKNFYALSSQSYQVFFMGIFQSYLPPLVRIFDPQHFFIKIYTYFKSKPRNKMILKQSQLTDLIQYAEYELGWCYIYFINLLFFCCFYASIQPIVVVFGLFGCIFMFWAQKYILLNRSQRPLKMAKALTSTVETLLSLPPLVLWIGHLVWVNAMANDFSSLVFIGNMVLMSVSLLYFLTPWKAFYMCAFHFPEEQLITYDSCRFKFSTEYDRINPASSVAGHDDYLEFMQDRKKQEEKDSILDNSNDNMAEHFDTRYVVQEISKIPSIFGRRNNVSKKIDDLGIKPRHLEGDDIELHVVPHNHSKSPDSRKESRLQQSRSQKIKIHHHQTDSPKIKSRYETEQVLALPKNAEDDVLSQTETQKIMTVNMNSNGNIFGRRKALEKRKSVSVHDKTEDYQYDEHNEQIK